MSFVPFTGARRILLLSDKLLPASPAPTAPLPPVRRTDATLGAEWLHALFGSLSAAIITSQTQAAAAAGVKVEPVTVEVVPPEAPKSAAVAAPSGAFSCLGDSCVEGRAPCYNTGGAPGSADPNESVCAAAQRDPAAMAMAKAVAGLLQTQVLHYGVVRGAATSVGTSGGTGTGTRPPLTVCVVGTSLSHLTALQHVSRSSGKSIFTILIDPRASANAAMRYECASKYGVQMVTHVPGDVATAIGQVLACYGRIQIGAPGPRHPSGQQLVECPYCPMHDLTPDQLWLHMPLYHITDTRNDPAVCPICRVHSERDSLARHVHNEHAPAGVHIEKVRSVPLYSYGLCVIRRPRDGRYLVVQEFSGSGFWLPGGSIDPGEVPWQAAARECQEEAGVRVRLTGLLRVEAQPHKGYARMRFIFFGEPEDPDAEAKTLPDHESAGACWVSMKELTERGGVRLRGPEPLEWFRYLDAGGTIHPISIMGHEGDPPPPVVRPTALGAESGIEEDFVM